MATRWQPSPVMKASFALHGAAAVGTLAAPAVWPWALGALALNHAVLTTACLLPRTTLLGPNLTRLPAAAAARREVAITIDDGPDPDTTPRVLDQLDAAGAKASFFCIGWRARENPALCREIVRRGHSVENHGDAHSWAFSLWGYQRLKADIAAAQATLSDITGQAPRYFRATAGLRNPFLDPALSQLDLRLSAWTRRAFDTRTGDPDLVHARLVRGLGPGDILLLHDGHGAKSADGQPVILGALPRLLGTLKEHRLITATLPQACP
jgi:peptidoglycan/xylan/chitin deacetylase (PgdA/CDA1 family)